MHAHAFSLTLSLSLSLSITIVCMPFVDYYSSDLSFFFFVFFFLFLSKPRRANTILRSFKPIFYAFYTFLFFFSTKRYLTRHQLCFRKYRFFETLSLSFPFLSFLLSLPTNVSLSFFSPERRQERHHFPTTFNNVACSPRLSPPPNLINRLLK